MFGCLFLRPRCLRNLQKESTLLSLLPSDNGWMDKNVIISSDVKRRSIASSVWYITAGNGGGAVSPVFFSSLSSQVCLSILTR